MSGPVGGPASGPAAWLDVLEHQARSLEDVAASVDPAAPVPWCAGWDVAALLDHVAGVHRMVVGWTSTGRRSGGWERPADVDPLAWYGDGWRALLQHLAATGPATRVPSWSPCDDTAAFWYRWVWGRQDDADPVVSSGDHAAIDALRAALARATK